MYFLCVNSFNALFGAASTAKPSGIFQMLKKTAFNRPLIVESYSHYEEMSCNDSFRSKIWHYCQESKISLQKRAKSLIFYSEQFFGHQFSAKSSSHIFWDKWNVEADSESLLKNLKLLPYSILMPEYPIKLYFTGSKDIQIWEYLRAHICSQKILLTPNWILFTV